MKLLDNILFPCFTLTISNYSVFQLGTNLIFHSKKVQRSYTSSWLGHKLFKNTSMDVYFKENEKWIWCESIFLVSSPLDTIGHFVLPLFLKTFLLKCRWLKTWWFWFQMNNKMIHQLFMVPKPHHGKCSYYVTINILQYY